jgi:hypothetical protein
LFNPQQVKNQDNYGHRRKKLPVKFQQKTGKAGAKVRKRSEEVEQRENNSLREELLFR